MTSSPRILIYLLRRDLRVHDNPILAHLARQKDQGKNKPSYTHVLPLYVFSAQQIEVSGFLSSQDAECPYPQARSQVGGFWRCGPHRAKFLAESVWNVKQSLDNVGSGLAVRVGMAGDVIRDIIRAYKPDGALAGQGEVVGLWMTNEEATEEKREERTIRQVMEEEAVDDFQLWQDEKYLVDDRDLPHSRPQDLPDVFTTFRKQVEPLRDIPRPCLGEIKSQELPSLPPQIPEQSSPFKIPSTLDGIRDALLKPLDYEGGLGVLPHPPQWPANSDVATAHPFKGGEESGRSRVDHLIKSGAMTQYKDTRNGLLGTDFSTKLAAFLALGCLTSRYIHWEIVAFENGEKNAYCEAEGYGKGTNKGTDAVRFELLWRDYMRLCARKFGSKLFNVHGFRGEIAKQKGKWRDNDQGNVPPAQPQSQPSRRQWELPEFAGDTQGQNTQKKSTYPVGHPLTRFFGGRTGTGLIDAAQRELYLTGYTSNRARQNVASFLAKHMGFDWRLGAEWYECLLVDYDVCSNWGNWAYVAGVGNDPRGEERKFNPVKQAFDYDKGGAYVRAWVDELRGLGEGQEELAGEDLMGVFQAWRLSGDDKRKLGIEQEEWVANPLVKIDFQVNRRGGGSGRGRGRGRGGWKGEPRGTRGMRKKGQNDGKAKNDGEGS